MRVTFLCIAMVSPLLATAPERNSTTLPDIPQDAEASAERRAERLAWHKATTVEAYDRVGKKNPKWDAAARKSLEALAQAISNTSYAGMDQQKVASDAAAEAIAAGCDDPLVEYAYGRVRYGFRQDSFGKDHLDRIVRAAQTMAKTEYPAVRRAHACTHAANTLIFFAGRAPTDAGRKQAAEFVDAALALVPEVLRDPHPEARRQAVFICQSAVSQIAQANKYGWDAAIAKVRPALAGAAKEKALVGFLVGDMRVLQANQTLGITNSNFTNRGADWSGFKWEMRMAEEAFLAAFEVDPTDPLIAAGMIRVCAARGHSRPAMEEWFRRAMKADGDCQEACTAKMQYLLPHFRGSSAEIIEFGRECVATENYDANLPYQLIAAHRELAWGKPFGHILSRYKTWDEMEAMFLDALQRSPNSKCVRTICAKNAAESGKWTFAHEQFEKLKGDYWRPAFASEKEAREMIEHVQQVLGITR